MQRYENEKEKRLFFAFSPKNIYLCINNNIKK